MAFGGGLALAHIGMCQCLKPTVAVLSAVLWAVADELSAPRPALPDVSRRREDQRSRWPDRAMPVVPRD